MSSTDHRDHVYSKELGEYVHRQSGRPIDGRDHRRLTPEQVREILTTRYVKHIEPEENE